MYKRVKIQTLDDYFKKLSSRTEKGVYFYRLNDHTPEIQEFLTRYLTEAKRTGVILVGKIPNPDERQLSYYEEMMGLSFSMNGDFFQKSLGKWMPGLDQAQRANVASSIYNTLVQMQRAGKNDNILKNAYIKFMCWLYYKFARIINQLGMDALPKLIYEGQISNYELKMLGILADAGCDIILVQKNGDKGYLNLDPDSTESFCYISNTKAPFPEDFSLLSLEKKAEEKAKMTRLYDENAVRICSTNTWISGDILDDALKSQEARGDNPKYIYNMFCRMTGVEDKAAYNGQLFKWKTDMENSGRPLFITENLPIPAADEIAVVNRRNYGSLEQLLSDMIQHVKCSDHQLESQARKALADLLSEENQISSGNLNRVKNRAVYLICWFNRYYRDLFKGYRPGACNTFVLFGVCRTPFESCFLRFLAKLPLDVLVLNPNLNEPCLLDDQVLFEQKYDLSMKLDKFPVNANDISYGTVAYHAEQELTEIMYQDSGLYRNQQYQNAVAISLQTMYEEMYILWDQEVKYRPNFETLEDKVVLPVIISKVSGVKDGNQAAYFEDIRKLVVEDTVVIPQIPYIYANSIADVQYAPQFLKNRKLCRDKIKAHHSYKYGIFREETQEYILDKLQELLDSGLIKGVYSQGMEFKTIAVALNLKKEMTRLIQKMDFTRKIPKLIFICATEQQCTAEDAILIAFLHFIGFDIAMFVPTGYQIVEQHYAGPLLVEHQIGEYMYDLEVPQLAKAHNHTSQRGFMDKIFKRR